MLRPIFLWLGKTALGEWMQASDWGFALTETVHLVALATLGGTVVVGSLAAARLLFRDSDPAAVVRGVYRIGAGAAAVIILSGTLLVSAKPLRYYLDNMFRTKMALLLLALLASVWVIRRTLLRPATGAPVALSARLIGLTPLLFWLGTGLAGRMIGYL